MTPPAAPVSSRAVVIGSSLWLLAALAFGASDVLGQMRPPGPQIIVLILPTVFAIAVSVSVPAVRTWVDSIPLRGLVGIHAVRLVGATFLILAARGAVATTFAERAGWGDITAAVGAVILVLSGLPRTTLHRWAYLVWNTFGVLDFIVAVGTATIVGQRGDTPGVEPLMRLPLVVVPILFVPILFAAHVAIYRRLIPASDLR